MTRSWLIGSGADCDVVVNRPTVSGRHCRLTREDDGTVLEDLGSSNGTYVNGARIDSPTRVTPGDAVTLGQGTPMPWPPGGIPDGWAILRIGREPDNDFVVDLPTVSGSHARLIWDQAAGIATIEDLGSSNGTAIGAPERRIGRASLAATETVYLGSHQVPAAELLAQLAPARLPSLVFRGRPMSLGRDPTCDRVIDLPMVSGRHARLSRAGDQTLIEDLGSSNGTFVNGRRIDRALAVSPGDLIGLGSYTLKLAVEDEETADEPFAISLSPSHAPSPPPSSSSWWPELSRAFASILSPRWRLAALIAQAPVAAGLIVSAFPLPVRAPIDAEAWTGISRTTAAGLFWLGFAGVGFGLVNAVLASASPRASGTDVARAGGIARLGARAVVLAIVGVAQCAVALAIVHAGMNLKGSSVAMLGVLGLASTVGLFLGLALVSIVSRPAPSLVVLPLVLLLVLLPMWLLGGHWRPLDAMGPVARTAADVLPVRWAFEGLLLLEAERNPLRNPPDWTSIAEAGEAPRGDLAEAFFPAETTRMGVRAGTIALGAMLFGLAAAAVFLAIGPDDLDRRSPIPDGLRSA
jgi:pSer/pThr/pTyr-binding forkhead associated (FHA) protein